MQLDDDFFKKNNDNVVKYLFTFSSQNWDLFLTTSDDDVEYNGTYYKRGIAVTSVNVSDLSKIDDICVEILDSRENIRIDTEKLLNAKVEIKIYIQNSIVNTVFNGFVSQINKNTNGMLNILINSSLMYFKKQIGELFSPLCRACIGDCFCKINIDGYKTIGEIVELKSDDCFIGNHQLNKITPTGYYKYGLVKFLTGKLSGIYLQIKNEIDGEVWVLKNTKLLTKGDKYEIIAGCDKTAGMCKSKFNNIANFRGEPFIE